MKHDTRLAHLYINTVIHAGLEKTDYVHKYINNYKPFINKHKGKGKNKKKGHWV